MIKNKWPYTRRFRELEARVGELRAAHADEAGRAAAALKDAWQQVRALRARQARLSGAVGALMGHATAGCE